MSYVDNTCDDFWATQTRLLSHAVVVEFFLLTVFEHLIFQNSVRIHEILLNLRVCLATVVFTTNMHAHMCFLMVLFYTLSFFSLRARISGLPCVRVCCQYWLNFRTTKYTRKRASRLLRTYVAYVYIRTRYVLRKLIYSFEK